MADIKIEVDPERFEKFVTDMLNALRALEIELQAYQYMFKGLAERGNFPGLELVLNTMRRSRVVVDPVNRKYDLALKSIQESVRGSIPDEVFLKLMRLAPPPHLIN